eukprot:TRINITY_DN3271_c0_g1_i1.p1 TRINITY_DN3271_c0_g1~~TRINITY_DN3271_c0_g1_i1.p1  ORF type:complete len:288 (-),score=11.82 TRINITY_DN3271_c0_g1_i1:64-927(-)
MSQHIETLSKERIESLVGVHAWDHVRRYLHPDHHRPLQWMSRTSSPVPAAVTVRLHSHYSKGAWRKVTLTFDDKGVANCKKCDCKHGSAGKRGCVHAYVALLLVYEDQDQAAFEAEFPKDPVPKYEYQLEGMIADNTRMFESICRVYPEYAKWTSPGVREPGLISDERAKDHAIHDDTAVPSRHDSAPPRVVDFDEDIDPALLSLGTNDLVIVEDLYGKYLQDRYMARRTYMEGMGMNEMSFDAEPVPPPLEPYPPSHQQYLFCRESGEPRPPPLEEYDITDVVNSS